MWSILILDLNNSLKQKDFFIIKSSLDEAEIICCKSKKQKLDDVRQIVFDENENKEAIINSVVKLASGDKIIIVRDVSKISKIKELATNITRDNQIAYYKRDLSGFKSVIFRCLSKITAIAFNQKYNGVDYSIIAYSKIPTKALKNVNVPSTLSRTNNFLAVKNIEVSGGGKYNFKYNKTKAILYAILPLILGLGLIATRILIKASLPIFVNLLIICFVILSLIFSVTFMGVWFIKSQIGDNILDKAEIKNKE